MMKFLMICLGGAIGTGARYLLSGLAMTVLGGAFPYGTLTVNIGGSFLIGLIMHFGLETQLLSPTLRIVLTTGVMGGFTTYSSFNYETIRFFQDGEIARGAVNIAVMLTSCLVAGLLGLLLAKRILGH